MSITMGTTLASLVTNKRRVSALKSLGIVTVGDALTYYPFRVTEPVPLRAIREAAPGQQMAAQVMAFRCGLRQPGGRPLACPAIPA